MMHPAASLTQYEMNMALEYLSLIKNVIKWEMAEYKHETLLHLLCSMANMLCNVYQGSFERYPLNRNEEIAGKFVSLVERNCKKHHDIQWYASQLCLSPKYVANVVKEVTGLTALGSRTRATLAHSFTAIQAFALKRLGRRIIFLYLKYEPQPTFWRLQTPPSTG